MYLAQYLPKRKTGRKKIEAIKERTRKKLSKGLSEKWIENSNASFCTFSPINKKIDKIKAESIKRITYHMPEKDYIMECSVTSE